ncbi:MAG: glutathionylspermidine synthase family protein [Limisphaerales bacterium]
MSVPISPLPEIEASQFRKIRQRTIFECCKWDPQVEDVSVLCPFPLLIDKTTWGFLSSTAEQLATETVLAENELIGRPDLHKHLGLPKPIRKLLAQTSALQTPDTQRLLRFDFHFTTTGWKISEVNSDVPGGFIEASGFTALMAEQVGHVDFSDPVEQLIQSILQQTKPHSTVALVHATAFVDDRQVMLFLARRMEQAGLRPILVGPDHVRWTEGQASIKSEWFTGPVDFVFRFYPGEWLPNLPGKTEWSHFFAGSRTPLCNPATALLTQSKRFPLVWDQLQTPLRTWRKFLPLTSAPAKQHLAEKEKWVFKPALGRVGESIGLTGATPEKEWKGIEQSLHKEPEEWVAQERFEVISVQLGDTAYYPCLGVYTIAGRAAGIYGRLSSQRLIDHRAQDVAVLIQHDPKNLAQPLTLAA